MYWFLYKEKQNLKNSQPQPKCTGFYIKKNKILRITNLNPKYWLLYKEKQNLNNGQPQPKCTGSYIKKNKILRTANLNPNVLVLI